MLRKLIIIALLILAMLPAADEGLNLINITAASSKLMKLPYTIKNIAVGNPDIADVLIISKEEILVNAKKPGITTVTIWDSIKNYEYTIAVNKSSEKLNFKIYKLQNLPLVRVYKENPDKPTVVKIEPLKETIDDLKNILSSYLEPSRYSVNPWTNSVLAVVSEEDDKKIQSIIEQIDRKELQVVFEVEIYELKQNNSLTSEIDIIYGKDESQVADHVYRDSNGEASVAKKGLSYTYNTKTYSATGELAEYTTSILRYMQIEGKAKILATPKILSINGKYSYIHAGEKIPVESTDSQGNKTVQYLPIGVLLGVVPRVDKEGNINCWLSTEVSSITGYDLKNNNPIIGSRDTVNEARLKDKETMILGGLLQEKENISETKIPVLGDLLGWIPVIGPFFKNQTIEKSTTELVITLRPKVMFEETLEARLP